MIDVRLSAEELDAVCSALRGLDEEYGLYIGGPGPAPTWPLDDVDLAVRRDEVTAAQDRGAALIARLEALRPA